APDVTRVYRVTRKRHSHHTTRRRSRLGADVYDLRTHAAPIRKHRGDGGARGSRSGGLSRLANRQRVGVDEVLGYAPELRLDIRRAAQLRATECLRLSGSGSSSMYRARRRMRVSGIDAPRLHHWGVRYRCARPAYLVARAVGRPGSHRHLRMPRVATGTRERIAVRRLWSSVGAWAA